MNKKLKISLCTLGGLAVVSAPLITVSSCGSKKTQNLFEKGDEHKQTDSWAKLDKLQSINWKSNSQPIGNPNLIKKISNWQEKNGINGFNANSYWVKSSNAPFSRSPRTMINGEPGETKNTPLNIKDIPAKILGMEELKSYIESIDKNGKIKISLIEGSEDDATGTLWVKTVINISGEQAEFQYKISGFTQTADIELNGENYKDISAIINALDKAKITNAQKNINPIYKNINLGFEKNISIMLPKDLKQELIDLYHSTNGGRLTVIGTYKGIKSAIALDKKNMLEELINAFGDVGDTKRFIGGEAKFALKKLSSGTSITAGFGKILIDYHNILWDKKPGQNNRKIDYLYGLFGNINDKVFNMFPRLITLFNNVATGVENMEMVKEWAKDHNIPNEKIEKLNHDLIKFVLDSGSTK
ncbi:hypothetical protein MYMA111404_03885 [Mycoplasma marinum]|uniref:Uncharacterized protein n=1 Tax=Mycoplasma marinum TaxID=1937190 RepID=A0A4R0XJ56_9MOLU|nr:hypothetical protein [Mycoplasma marinum]TCG10656.1 hypothetical protein C4B24_04295 [Mycoplasma marinum]